MNAETSFLQELAQMDSPSQFREAAEHFWDGHHKHDGDKFTPEDKEESIAQITEVLTLYGKIERDTAKEKADRLCRSVPRRNP